MSKRNFKKLFQDAKQRDTYWASEIVQTFTDDLYKLMRRRNVSKSELARRIGSSPAYVTKVMRGDANFTVESMVRLARAVDGKVNIHLCSKDHNTQWFDRIAKHNVPDLRHSMSNSKVVVEFDSYRKLKAGGKEQHACAATA